MQKRVSCYIDGFNLYHAVKALKAPHLKWLNLEALMQRQISPQTETLVSVKYFSAFADWMPAQKQRHEAYVSALEIVGVTPILGQFKEKDRWCKHCGGHWKGHEEKETDVNIAIHLLNDAYLGIYDKALVVSRDSDLKPAISMVRQSFPDLEIEVVAPPHKGHSNDLLTVATGKRKISTKQLSACLFPANISAGDGSASVVRPSQYNPPH